MVLTTSAAKAAYEHIVHVVLQADRTNAIYLALDHEGCNDIYTFLNLKPADIKELKYVAIDGDQEQYIRKGDAKKIELFLMFYKHKQKSVTPITDQTWTSLTAAEFNAYRLTL